MAVVKVKNSNTTSSTPPSLARGELAVNLQDKLIWIGNAAAGVTALTGTIAIQNANSVTLTGGTINGTTIGATTATTGAFTTLTATTFNKLTLTAPASGATLTLADGSSLVLGGAYSLTFTCSATTSLTLPTSGLLANSARAVGFALLF